MLDIVDWMSKTTSKLTNLNIVASVTKVLTLGQKLIYVDLQEYRDRLNPQDDRYNNGYVPIKLVFDIISGATAILSEASRFFKA